MGLFETLFMWLVVLFTSWWSVVPVVSPVATTTATVVSVIDGDTIDVMTTVGRQRVRYIGIDTPEPYAKGDPECGSHEATAENKRLMTGKTVELVADKEDKDKYGRLLRYVYVDSVMVNETLVRDGFARALTIPPDTRFADHFELLADLASVTGKGVWGCPQK